MAVNARKGSAHSLQQTDFLGTLDPEQNIDAGQLVYKNSTGYIDIVPRLNNATRADATNMIYTTGLTGPVGFAVTTQDEGDAIESGKIGVYALDGGSVIETSYFSGSVTQAMVGYPVVQDANGGTDGNVCVVNPGTTEKIIGYVYDIPRSIYIGQTPVTMLPVKLSF